MKVTAFRRAAALFGALAVVFSSLVIAAPASAATTVDLVSQLNVPVAQAPGSPFSSTATVRNSGVDAADGSVMEVLLAPGTTNVAASCTAATGDASCDLTAEVRQSEKGPVVTATLPRLPRGGSVSLTITGTFPLSSSAPVTVNAIVPPGTVDSHPPSNSVTQSTALRAVAEVAVTKSVDRLSVAEGETVTYTVGFANNGPNSIYALPITDEMFFSVGARITYSVACVATPDSIPCPSWANGVAQNVPSGWVNMVDAKVDLPSGSNLTVTVTVTPTQLARVPASGGYIQNRAIRGNIPSVELVGTADAWARNVTIIGSPCPAAAITVNKVADRDQIASGETVTFTVTFRNNGPDSVTRLVTEDYLLFGVGARSSGMISCVSTPDSIPCPVWAQDKPFTTTNTVQSLFSDVTDIPVGKELVLTVPVTPVITTCAPDGVNRPDFRSYREPCPARAGWADSWSA